MTPPSVSRFAIKIRRSVAVCRSAPIIPAHEAGATITAPRRIGARSASKGFLSSCLTNFYPHIFHNPHFSPPDVSRIPRDQLFHHSQIVACVDLTHSPPLYHLPRPRSSAL